MDLSFRLRHPYGTRFLLKSVTHSQIDASEKQMLCNKRSDGHFHYSKRFHTIVPMDHGESNNESCFENHEFES
jgi:hypothetical protein